jgi:hypothetical protein
MKRELVKSRENGVILKLRVIRVKLPELIAKP